MQHVLFSACVGGGGRVLSVFRLCVWFGFLMPFVDEFRLKIFPNLCLSPACERVMADIEQYSDVGEGIAVEV